MCDNKLIHESVHGGQVVEALEAEPHGLGAGLAVAFPAEEAAELCSHTNGLSERGRLFRCRVMGPVGYQSLPFVFLKEYRARDVRGFSSELGEVIYAPRHHHVYSQTRFNAVGAAKLSLFDLASALEGTMVDLDPPTTGIPFHLFHCEFGGVDLARGDELPFNGLGPWRDLGFLRQNRPNGQWLALALETGRFQFHLGKADCQNRFSRRSRALSRDSDRQITGNILREHLFPDIAIFVGKGTLLLRSDKQLRPGGIRQCELKKIVEVGLSVCDTDEDGIRTLVLGKSHLLETLEPLRALFLFNGQRGPAFAFAECLGLSDPALHVEETQRSPFEIKRHGVMNNQTDGALGKSRDGTKTLCGRMRAIIEGCGIRYGQRNGVFPSSMERCFVVGLQDLFHARVLVSKKPIGCFGLCSILASLGNISLRTSIQILSQSDKPLGQPQIGEIRFSKLILRPVVRFCPDPFCGGIVSGKVWLDRVRDVAQKSAGLVHEGEYVDVLRRDAVSVVAVHAPSARCRSYVQPICSSITSAPIGTGLHIRFNEKGLKSVPAMPVLRNPPGAHSQKRGRQDWEFGESGEIGYCKEPSRGFAFGLDHSNQSIRPAHERAMRQR